jgi:hypothetical protein
MQKIKYRLQYAMFSAIIAMVLVSCETDEIDTFSAQQAINFTSLKTEYSFLGNPNNSHTQEIEVRILGTAMDKDRFFNVEVVNDTTTTATTNQYEILSGVVKAGEFTGKLTLKLNKSAQLDTTSVKVNLNLIDSQDFKAGNIEAVNHKVLWTNKVIVPAWRFYSFFFCRTQSTLCYRIVVETTGLKTFSSADYRAVGGPAGATALGTTFGDYVKQWNLDNPNNKLRHDDGALAGELIVPIHYTKSKYD